MAANGPLYSSDYEWALKFSRVWLDWLGVWPRWKSNEVLQFMQMFCKAMFVVFFSIYPQMYSLYLTSDNMALMTQNMLSSVEACLCVMKLFIFWFNKGALETILNFIATDWCKLREAWERDIMVKMARRGRLLTAYAFGMSFACVGAFIFIPMLGWRIRREVTNITNFNGRRMPVPSHYQYDFSKTPYYEICYAAQIITLSITALCLTGPITLFGTLVYHVCGQLEILCFHAKILCTPKIKNTGYKLEYSSDWWMQLRNIVIYHVNIIRTVGKIENYFSTFLLTQILFVPVPGCLAGLRAINMIAEDGSLPVIEVLVLFAVFSTMIAHLFVYCYIGEYLSEYGENLRLSIYESNWYTFYWKRRLHLIPIMCRSKQMLQLTAGKYMILNLQTYCQIVKNLLAYISVLVAVIDKSES